MQNKVRESETQWVKTRSTRNASDHTNGACWFGLSKRTSTDSTASTLKQRVFYLSPCTSYCFSRQRDGTENVMYSKEFWNEERGIDTLGYMKKRAVQRKNLRLWYQLKKYRKQLHVEKETWREQTEKRNLTVTDRERQRPIVSTIGNISANKLRLRPEATNQEL